MAHRSGTSPLMLALGARVPYIAHIALDLWKVIEGERQSPKDDVVASAGKNTAFATASKL